jgi:hypothetical protein
VNEEEGFWIVFLFDGQELVVVSAKERFLPVEFVSRGLRRATARLEFERQKKKIGDSYLVEVCSGIRGDTFEDLHILDEELASGIDLGDIRAIFPECAQSGVD